jgi:hypothetical protein
MVGEIMMKKSMRLSLAAVAALGLWACGDTLPTALAPAGLSLSLAESANPTVAITNPAGNLTYASFPQTQTVAVTVSRNYPSPSAAGQRNLCGVNQFRLFIGDAATLNIEEDDPVQHHSGALASTEGSGSTADCPTQSRNFVHEWLIAEPGVYKIVATVQTTGSGGATGDEEMTLEVFAETVVVSHPAAPAVAADLLAAHGISHRYGSGRTGGNHISDVAREMSSNPGTDFMGVPKSDPDAYRCKVANFLFHKDPAAFNEESQVTAATPECEVEDPFE